MTNFNKDLVRNNLSNNSESGIYDENSFSSIENYYLNNSQESRRRYQNGLHGHHQRHRNMAHPSGPRRSRFDDSQVYSLNRSTRNYSTSRIGQHHQYSMERMERRPIKKLSVHYDRDLYQMIDFNGNINQKVLYSHIHSNLPDVTEEKINMVLKKGQFLSYLNELYSFDNYSY